MLGNYVSGKRSAPESMRFIILDRGQKHNLYTISLNHMKKITIIGFGRFGKVLYRLLHDDFEIVLYNRSEINKDTTFTKKTTITDDIQKAYESDVIFYCVPIGSFEKVIASHQKYFRPEHVLIDILSVKLHPAQVFEKYLAGKQTQALLTHPLFGPDSSKEGFAGLPIVLDKFKTENETYSFWKDYFKKKKLQVIEMTANDHDKMAANTQGLTHFIGRLLEEYDLQETPIDTLGTQKLLEVKKQTCNDTWELFTDLQHFNPYTKHMRIKLGKVYDKLYNKLLPSQINKECITIGIQGGSGSFNEEAISYYLQRNTITNYHIKYLFTSKNVLQSLSEGEIDQGLFALHNSVGGIVMESIEAMAEYKFTIVEEFAIKISHALMVRKDAALPDITEIMTHPQVLAQCKKTLSQKYPYLKQTSGEDELVDHALVAKYLSEEKLPKNVATMGSKILAQIYDLHIVEDNLQDSKENYTSFLLVKRM
jgi:prephenate dehydrogenase